MQNNIKSFISHKDTLAFINVFLLVLLVPVIVGVVFKILSVTSYPDNRLVEKASKYSFGSFFYYGLLFFAYASFTFLFIHIQSFETSLSTGLGILIGVIFFTFIVLWTIASVKYSSWFGSFRKKFFKFTIS